MKLLFVPLLAFLSLQQFRVRSERVTVDVGVFSGNRAAAGLAGADFVLADNGVPQQLELFSIEAVPVDVTFVLHAHKDSDFNLREIGGGSPTTQRFTGFRKPDQTAHVFRQASRGIRLAEPRRSD